MPALVARYANNPILRKDDVPFPVETVHNAGVVKLLGASGSGAPRLHVFDDATHALQFDQVDELASRIMSFP